MSGDSVGEEHSSSASEETSGIRSSSVYVAKVKSRIAALLNEKNDDGNEIWNTRRVEKVLSNAMILSALGKYGNEITAAVNYLISLLGEDHKATDSDYLPDSKSDASGSEESIDGDDLDGDGVDLDNADVNDKLVLFQNLFLDSKSDASGSEESIDGDGDASGSEESRDGDDHDGDGDDLDNADFNDELVLTNEPNLPSSRFEEDFDVEGVLGKGGYGVVFKCKRKLDRQDYAVKRISMTVNGKTPMEVYALAVLQHPHIVQYHQAWMEAYSKTGSTPPDSFDGENAPEDQMYPEPEVRPPHRSDGQNEEDQCDKVLYIQMQCCPESFGYGDKDTARRYFLQILQGLSFMHEKRIAHCDLKETNVLLDKESNARICDLGLAHFLSGADLVQDIEILPLDSVENKAYRAPEVLQSPNSISEKVDIYSLGVMVVGIFSPSNPSGMERSKMITELKNGEELPLFLRDEPQEIKDIFFSMVKKEPGDRPCAAEVLNALTSKWANE